MVATDAEYSDVELDEYDAIREEDSLEKSENVTKFQTAADIVNRAIVELTKQVKAGAKVIDLCKAGDKLMEEYLAGVYNKAKDGKKVKKGIAFPTSINVNNVVCHFAPLASDPEAAMELKDGDVVKLEVGAHIDGFPAMVGHTVVVGATAQTPVTGRKADLIQAAYLASEAALRLLRPGKNNFDVTDTVQKVAQEFGVLPMEGMLSTELRRTVLDGQKQIILNPTEEQRRQFQVSEFASGEVYSIDVLMTTSEDAKGRPSQKYRTTIYKRLPDAQYSLKMQTSRKVYSEITQKADCMPFNLRAADDEKKARMGVVECAKHGLLLPYDIIEEKEGEFVAQFLFTALLMPSGSILKITNPPFDQSLVKSDKSLQSVELKQLVTGSLKAPKKK